MVWLDRFGSESAIDTSWLVRFTTASAGETEAGWSLSPDGKLLALALRTPLGDDIWIKELPSGPLSRATFSQGPHLRPRWAPDGRSLTFIGMANGRFAAFEVPADGSGDERLILEHQLGVLECNISRDGRWLVARVGLGRMTVARDLVITPRIGDSITAALLATPFVEAAVSVAPNGRWMAYQSDETGRMEVYVRSFPDPRRIKRQISSSGGYSPLWTNDGELLFMSMAGVMTSVRVLEGGEIGPARGLFPRTPGLYGGVADAYTPWDVTTDGKRFIMARRVAEQGTTEASVLVVDNWFAELRSVARR
jgi:hypothetical protein